MNDRVLWMNLYPLSTWPVLFNGGGLFHWQVGHISVQRAKKVVSDSPGLVDFATGLVKSVFNLPDGQVMFFEEFK